MIDWEDVRHFVALAEAGSLSAAARALKVDHATVGRRVAALEQALGVTLLERVAKRCVLTDAGRQVATIASGMQAQAFALERAGRALHAPLAGNVTISAPPFFASHFLAPRLGTLRQQYPNLHLTLLGTKASVSLGRREADLAIRLSRPAELGAVTRIVGHMAFWLYAAPDYIRQTPATAWTFIGYDSQLEQVPQQICLQRFAGDRPLVLRASDLSSQFAAARAGLGIAALPRFMADDDAGLQPLIVDFPPVAREMWLMVHADLRRVPAVRAVMDFMIGLLADGPLSRQPRLTDGGVKAAE